MSKPLPWFGPPPPTACPKCGGAAIEWSAQTIYDGRPVRAVGRAVVQLDCVDCRERRALDALAALPRPRRAGDA